MEAPRAIHGMGPLNGQPRLYRDKRTGVVGRFVGSRRRDGHATRDRHFRPVITMAKEHLFEPSDGSAAYWVAQPTFTRKFEDAV